uniref:COBRA-like protein 10 2 n=1 Tax=Populus tomentosa TaxID=118781 RepID=A0A1L6K4Y6_POPTO|nr:COBRA-like protein 10 precursor 2 [Populus tomentosa]
MLLSLPSIILNVCHGQTDDYESPAAPPPGLDECNGIFLTYSFTSREKEYPKVKNASAQAWAFKSLATITNTGEHELKGWQMFVGFQHKEVLVSASGAVVVDGDDFPVAVGNGTIFAGNPQVDLKTAIETAGDFTQIAAQIEIAGSVFGIKPPGVPMPKNIKLVNDGYKCPKPTLRGKSYIRVCCKKDPKAKEEKKRLKFLPRRYGDLSLTYDVLQAYGNNYQAQVTMDNIHPLGRLDHWNLTWEWMNGEFISTMRGAYTHKRDFSECIYGTAGKYYKDFDFSTIINCEKKPVISDLPPDRKNDSQVGKLPYCCRNGTLLPSIMDESKARSIFQLQVYKMPPFLNRTALVPPEKWKIDGVVNPQYKCGPPIRVDPTEFPDPSGLDSKTYAVASWQVTCNITRPKEKLSRCCVSFSAYYNRSAIPCNTCACGCDNNKGCSQNAKAMLLPPESLLVPSDNRTEKALAWAALNKFKVPNPRPCPDNCPVSINWHIDSDFKTGWTASVTLFNWDDSPFEDWFAAIKLDKAYKGLEGVYSLNGTKFDNLNNTILLQGLPGLNFLMGEVNGTRPGDPRVPGKQQTKISFIKKRTPGINIPRGDGFPTRILFNGEECALPTQIPRSTAQQKSHFKFLIVIIMAIVTFILMSDHLH